MGAGDVRVLGPVEIVGGNGRAALTTKQRRLLAALVLAEGRFRTVDELVDALWGETPPASGAKLVQVYVSQLRKSLPERVRIVTGSGSYALDAPPDAVDARRFERFVVESASARTDGNHPLAASLAAPARGRGRSRRSACGAAGHTATWRTRSLRARRRSASKSFA
jgi:DNA-binding SARP family transcriptional activator